MGDRRKYMKSLLGESRAHGWASAESAPEPFKQRIIEIRSALFQNKPVPAPSPEWIAGCEQRSAVASAALSTFSRLFPNFTKTQRQRPAVALTSELAVLRSIAHRQAAELREDQRVLARARRDAEAKRAADELAEQVAEMTAEVFPWERRN
jgi:hypothetical protein